MKIKNQKFLPVNDPVTLTIGEFKKVFTCRLKGKTNRQTSKVMKWSEEFTRKFHDNLVIMTPTWVEDTVTLKLQDITKLSEGDLEKFMTDYNNQKPLEIPGSLSRLKPGVGIVGPDYINGKN